MILTWPALSSETQLIEGNLHYLRGVHGKVHRAASDYRWIAASPELEWIDTKVLKATSFGTEDQPREIFAWAVVENGYLAVHAYPSRARDAAGRPGGVEKQVLHWAPGDHGVPPAVAAFFLLEAVRGFDDSIWWNSWESPEWRRREFFLPLDATACRPVPWQVSRLQALIDSGITALRAAVGEDSLARFYQSVLDEHKPALLPVESGSLPGAAVAALLLPLPPQIAATTALCGGLPTTDVREEMLKHWSGVVCARGSVFDAEPGASAQSMARALLAGNPDIIVTEITRPEHMSTSAKYLTTFLASSNRSLADPPPDYHWQPIPASEVRGLVDEILRLDEEAESLQVFPGDPERQVALRRHLRLKGDLARAWLYACAPTKDLLQKLPPRADAIPPALWFAPLVPDSFRLCERYEPADFAALVEHSLNRGGRHDRVIKWLETVGGNRGERVNR